MSARGASAWITAHWGWMPPREYTAFLQTGQTGLVEIGVCQCLLSATTFTPFGGLDSPRGAGTLGVMPRHPITR